MCLSRLASDNPHHHHHCVHPTRRTRQPATTPVVPLVHFRANTHAARHHPPGPHVPRGPGLAAPAPRGSITRHCGGPLRSSRELARPACGPHRASRQQWAGGGAPLGLGATTCATGARHHHSCPRGRKAATTRSSSCQEGPATSTPGRYNLLLSRGSAAPLPFPSLPSSPACTPLLLFLSLSTHRSLSLSLKL